MKKLIVLLVSILCIYVIYFDLTQGTLPQPHIQTKKADAIAENKISASQPYFEVKVAPGETVLTIVEHQLAHNVPVAIDDVITDFEKLNSGLQPEKIQIGKSYRFPDYSKVKNH